jgi:hypothetical protein
MTAAKVRSMLQIEPFRPFRLVLGDGRQFRIDHRELLVLTPGERIAILFEPGTEDSSFMMIDLRHVATLEPVNWPPTSSADKNGRRKR